MTEGLAQGPYVAARSGVEPAAFRTIVGNAIYYFGSDQVVLDKIRKYQEHLVS